MKRRRKLTIAKATALLAVLGGSISVKSTVGRGSIFRVRLPVHSAQRTPAARLALGAQQVVEVLS